MDTSELNIHAIVRIKPSESPDKKDIIYAVSPDHKEIQLNLRETERYAFTFDRIIDPFVTNVELFESTARILVDKLIVCKNACLISYGEPNWKNDCVFGVEITNRDSKGLIFRSLTYLFSILDRYTATKDFRISLGLYEIYLDKIRDMGRAYLDRLETGDWQHNQFASSNLNLLEREGRTDIENLAMIPISNIDEAMALIQMGLELRQSQDSRNNRQSVKSHIFLNISLAQKYKNTAEVFTSVLTFAALAYQEKTPKNLLENLKKQDTYHLNASFMALEKVLNNLFQRREAKLNGEIPYKENKLTRILQNVCNTESQILLLVTLPSTAKNKEEAVSILQFAERCFKIEREKKKKNILAALAPISGQQLERVRRLEDEVNELKSQIDKGQTSHELKLKAFAKLIGVENDLEAILQAPPGSKERNIARNYKEAITKLDNITKRNSDLERKLEDNKRIFEEIKRVELNNQDKFAREVYDLESQITDLRGQIQELKDKTENSARDQLHERAEELQKLLIHSHMLLEEQAAVIHNLPFNMNSRAADLRNMSDMRDLGRSEVEHELKKKFRDEELAQQKRIANITEQYNYILEEKQKEINQFILESREYDRMKKETLTRMQDESVTLFEMLKQQRKVITDVEGGVYNNGIKPVLIPSSDLPLLPTQQKFPHLFKALTNTARNRIFNLRSVEPRLKTALNYGEKTARGFSSAKNASTYESQKELPRVASAVIIDNPAIDIPENLNELDTSEIKEVVLKLRRAIEQRKELLKDIDTEQKELRDKNSEMQAELEKTVQERDKCKNLYTQEVRHKMEQNIVIESQKRLLDKQAFITQAPSRPSTQGQRLDTASSIKGSSRPITKGESHEGFISAILFTERNARKNYIKMFLLHLMLLYIEVSLALHFMVDDYKSFSLLLHYCYILMTVDIVKSLVFFSINLLEKICYPDGWDNKANYLGVLDFLFSFISLCVMLLEFNQLSRISNLYLLHFVDSLIFSGIKLWKQGKDFIATRKLMRKVEKFPDATEEEIHSANDKCIICFEEMHHAKKISCGHLFHFKCLKEYFQNNTNPECPTCKNPITEAPIPKPRAFNAFPKPQDPLKVTSILTHDLPSGLVFGKPTAVGAVAWGLPQAATVHKISKETEKLRKAVENMNSFMIRFYQHPPTEFVEDEAPQEEQKTQETRRIPMSALERLEKGSSMTS